MASPFTTKYLLLMFRSILSFFSFSFHVVVSIDSVRSPVLSPSGVKWLCNSSTSLCLALNVGSVWIFVSRRRRTRDEGDILRSALAFLTQEQTPWAGQSSKGWATVVLKPEGACEIQGITPQLGQSGRGSRL